jgi:signal transduction histidine kinase
VNVRLLRTTAFRLALGYLALFSGSVILLLGFIYWATAGSMLRQLDETIDTEIVGLAEQYRQRGVEGLAEAIRQRMARDPRGSEVYLLTDPRFRPVIGNLNRWPTEPESSDGWIQFDIHDRTSASGSVYLARTRHFILAGGFHLLVGRDARDIDEVQQLILRSLAWGLAFTLALGLAGGLLMARASLRRLETINRASREIMQEGDLSRRVPVRGSDDDFDHLAQNLNAMLDRIETLMEGIRHVSEGIAHDLRSPLTRLRHRLESMKMRMPANDEQRRLIEEATTEADALLGTFNALLRIAEAESRRASAAFTDVDLETVVRDAVDLYEPVATERQQTLDVSIAAGASVRGDRNLLAQALTNLLDNAVKYTPPGGRITVELTNNPTGPVLSVADSGPGIPAELRGKVLERFFRIDTSRSTPGSGLGLSLVAAVAGLHNATLTLDDNHPGLRVILSFLPAGISRK